MNIQIEKIPSYRIAYIRRIGAYGEDNVKTMEKLKVWAKSNNLLNGKSIILGIAQDNPNITKPENCRYDTCFVVDESYLNHDNDVRFTHISGGNYAVFKIEHTKKAIQLVWNNIFTELEKHHYKLDLTKPILERYIKEMVDNNLCEICAPIK